MSKKVVKLPSVYKIMTMTMGSNGQKNHIFRNLMCEAVIDYNRHKLDSLRKLNKDLTTEE